MLALHSSVRLQRIRKLFQMVAKSGTYKYVKFTANFYRAGSQKLIQLQEEASCTEAIMSETIVLITGSNQGLGYEVVKKLAAENESYRILLCSRNLQNGQEAAAEVTSLGKNTSIDVIQLDVTSDDSIGEAVKKVEQKCGRVDVLFNNAGIASAKGSQREAMRQSEQPPLFEKSCD